MGFGSLLIGGTWGLAGWEGGWLSNSPPPPPGWGMGQFWFPGFSQIPGGWVSEFTPPPVTKQIPGPCLTIAFPDLTMLAR